MFAWCSDEGRDYISQEYTALLFQHMCPKLLVISCALYIWDQFSLNKLNKQAVQKSTNKTKAPKPTNKQTNNWPSHQSNN